MPYIPQINIGNVSYQLKDKRLDICLNDREASVKPETPTGHGLYKSDGTYTADAGWSSFYVPAFGKTKYRMTFSGTSHNSNCVNEYAENGNLIVTHGKVANMEFESDANCRFIAFAAKNNEVRTVDLYQQMIRGEIAEIKDMMEEASLDENMMRRFSFSNAKTQRPLHDVPAGTDIYMKVISCTDPSILGLTMYGITTGEDNVNLGTEYVGKGIIKATTPSAFDHIQVALNPYPSESFSGTVVYDILGTTTRGYESDIADLQNNTVPRNLNTRIVRIFKKVTCVGDSYTAGYINLDNEDRVIEPEWAWPRFMELSTGSEYVNCGVSGANVWTWLADDNGLLKASTSGRAQAYIVGLMINDKSSDPERSVPVGTASDIGTENYTYYAGMSKVIRELNALNPTAKIFVLTLPQGSDGNPYNTAVRTIVSTYKDTYPVHCIDISASGLFTYRAKSFSNDYVGGHYTGVGYEQMAEVLEYAISKYIGEHVSEFQDVHKIPYDI